ncbi:MAG TPA: DUF4199 domain-containing protein [Chitinophagaceae bacterium]|nr:DUF4199 domain-containing protein [Chitinophagaceae bacterium]
MKKTVLRYGLFSCIALVVMSILGLVIFGNPDTPNYTAHEVFGYTTMILSMVFVFFGIKHYRDQVNGGMLSFGKGMKVGLLIVLIPSVAFGLFNLIYTGAIDPEFMDKYYQHQLSQMQQRMTPGEFNAARATMEKQKEMFSNPVLQFLVMGLTVFVIGVIASVISSLVLKRRVG